MFDKTRIVIFVVVFFYYMYFLIVWQTDIPLLLIPFYIQDILYVYVAALGNYIYIETSSPRKPGEKAKIVVTAPKKGKKACLSFYYHMYGASAGSLNVYNGNDTVFNVSGSQGNRWVMVEKSIHLNSEASNVWFPNDRSSSSLRMKISISSINNVLSQNIVVASGLKGRKPTSHKRDIVSAAGSDAYSQW